MMKCEFCAREYRYLTQKHYKNHLIRVHPGVFSSYHGRIAEKCSSEDSKTQLNDKVLSEASETQQDDELNKLTDSFFQKLDEIETFNTSDTTRENWLEELRHRRAH